MQGLKNGHNGKTLDRRSKLVYVVSTPQPYLFIRMAGLPCGLALIIPVRLGVRKISSRTWAVPVNNATELEKVPSSVQPAAGDME